MGRILSIDYGRKRTGIAVSDPLKIIANGLTTVPTHTLFAFLEDYFKKEDVETVVIGLPLNMDNTPSESVRYINPFMKKFEKLYPQMPLVQVDERFTSKIAFQAMIDGGVKKMARRDKAMVDKVSATIILQTYMSMQEGSFH